MGRFMEIIQKKRGAIPISVLLVNSTQMENILITIHELDSSAQSRAFFLALKHLALSISPEAEALSYKKVLASTSLHSLLPNTC